MNAQTVERRPLGALGRMGMVAGVHAAALYLIATSLGIVPPLIEAEPPPFVIAQSPQPPPPDPPPTFEPRNTAPPLTAPVPVVLPDDAFSEDAPFVEFTDDPPVVPPIVPPRDVQMVGVRADARFPLTRPPYPQKDVREGNEGSVELEVYVMPNGRIGDVRVLKSTGSPTLDQSAVDEAKRRWRMLPAMRDGEAYAQWHRLRVVFDLKDR
jgi:periplasmic protein TonB